MFCKYCGKKIDTDSVFCMFCGKRVNGHNERKVKENYLEETHDHENGTYTAPDGKTYTVRNRILYDKDGWDVGRVPDWWG